MQSVSENEENHQEVAGATTSQAPQKAVRHELLPTSPPTTSLSARRAMAVAGSPIRTQPTTTTTATASPSTHSPARGLGAAGEAILAYERQVRQLEDITEQIRTTHNSIEECKGNIRVICRVRPPNSKELTGGAAAATASKGSHNSNTHNSHTGYQPIELLTQYDVRVKDKTYEFYRVYGPENTQEDVFGELRGLVTSAVQGYHLSVLAYGQTGSGKTFTMMGPEEDRGVNFRVLAELFQQQKSSNRRFETTMSAIEIYNEAVYDLLAPASSAATTALHVREDKRLGPYVEELSVHQVVAAGEAERVLERAVANRTVRSTEANRESSRSHCVVTISVRSWPADGSSGPATEGKLHLIDLAGSERIGSKPDMSKAQGDELKNINLSLTTLRRCLEALRAKKPHVPFRDSLLTFLLTQSFSGDGKVVMVCNVGPAATKETINSIKFCTNVRAVELGLGKLHEGGASSKPKTAQRLADLEALHAKLISRRDTLRAEIEGHREAMAALRQRYEENVLLLGGGNARTAPEQLIEELRAEIARLKRQIRRLQNPNAPLEEGEEADGDYNSVALARTKLELDTLRAEVTDRIESLEVQLQEATEREAEQARYVEDVARYAEVLAEKARAGEILKRQYLQRLSVAEAEAEAEARHTLQSLLKCQHELAQVKGEATELAAREEALMAVAEDTEEQLRKAQAECAEVRRSLEVAMSDLAVSREEIVAAQARADQAAADHEARLLEAREILEAERDEAKELRSARKMLTKENELLTKENELLVRKLADITFARDKVQYEIGERELLVESLSEANDDLKREVENLRSTVVKLQEQLGDKVAEGEISEDKISSINDLLSSAGSAAAAGVASLQGGMAAAAKSLGKSAAAPAGGSGAGGGGSDDEQQTPAPIIDLDINPTERIASLERTVAELRARLGDSSKPADSRSDFGNVKSKLDSEVESIRRDMDSGSELGAGAGSAGGDAEVIAKLKEASARQLAQFEQLKDALMRDLQNRCEKVIDLEMMLHEAQNKHNLLVKQASNKVLKKKVTFLETNLEALVKVHLQLVNHNGQLKIETSLQEKKLEYRNERIANLEKALEERTDELRNLQEQYSADQARLAQLEEEGAESATSAAQVASVDTSAQVTHIAKPITGGSSASAVLNKLKAQQGVPNKSQSQSQSQQQPQPQQQQQQDRRLSSAEDPSSSGPSASASAGIDLAPRERSSSSMGATAGTPGASTSSGESRTDSEFWRFVNRLKGTSAPQQQQQQQQQQQRSSLIDSPVPQPLSAEEQEAIVRRRKQEEVANSVPTTETPILLPP